MQTFFVVMRCMWLQLLLASSLLAAVVCWTPSPVESSVYDRGLVEEKLSFNTFAVEGNSYHSSTATIRFEGDVILCASSASSLPHILPFLSKATVVSTPLVYISRNSSSTSRFHVQHDALPPAVQGAVARIRPSGAKFAPIVALVNCSAGDLDLLFRDASAQNALMTDLVAILRALSADGAVLDFVSCLGREQALHTKPQMHRLLSFLGSSLLRKKMLSILSVPPIQGSAVVDPQVFAAADFEALEYSYSFFHVPFSAHALPSASPVAGPRAPLAWIIKTIRAMLPSGSVKTKRAGKLLASIDMRAAVFNKSGGWYVHGDELAKLLLNNTGRCMWDADAMEHSCTYSELGQRHEMFLPSLRGLQAHNTMAAELGVGIGWTTADGAPPMFFDML